MEKEENVSLKFLEQQLDWCKKQDLILEKMEATLYEILYNGLEES